MATRVQQCRTLGGPSTARRRAVPRNATGAALLYGGRAVPMPTRVVRRPDGPGPSVSSNTPSSLVAGRCRARMLEAIRPHTAAWNMLRGVNLFRTAQVKDDPRER